jgi:hypothetical protein
MDTSVCEVGRRAEGAGDAPESTWEMGVFLRGREARRIRHGGLRQLSFFGQNLLEGIRGCRIDARFFCL